MISRPIRSPAAEPAGLRARRVALDAVLTVLKHHRPLDETFEGHPGLSLLPERDRAFAYTLARTVFRRLGQLDARIDARLPKPLPERLMTVRGLLRLGAAQLVYLRTPAHAAVHTAVSLARATGQGSCAALINAVLRRIADEAGPKPAAQAPDEGEPRNVPSWLWESWAGAWGEDVALEIVRAHIAEPPLDLTLKPGEDASAWATTLGAKVLPTGSLRLYHAGPVTALPGYHDGAWWVQDAAAALPVRLLGDVRGRAVVDLCAAPGGKTAQLAAAGARVTAVDRSAGRLKLVHENLRRLHLQAETIAADATEWRPPEPVDRLLLDAPCSATGTIRRHPDVAWLKSADEVRKLAGVQARLLAAAASMLAPEGLLVYCACSLQPEEGALLVDSLLSHGLPLQREPIGADEIGGCAELLTSAGDLRTLPCHLGELGGLDGFYAVRLRRLGT